MTGNATHTGRAPLRQVDFLVLAVLNEGPLHGYGIVQGIEEITEGRVRLRPGDVYRVLYRMSEQGLLQAATQSPEIEDEGARRTYYEITDAGRATAKDEATLLSGVSARLLAVADRSGDRR